jgi:crotonobetainyl-CoA:carnitine CoA-transferase CaiB-like acyl-CoA transferase
MMSVNGEADGEGLRHGIAVVDTMTAMHATSAILAALYARRDTGRGQHIDLALYDTALAALGNLGSYYLVSGQAPKRAGNGHVASAPNNSFRAADGRIYIVAATQKLFAELCQALGHPEWANDPRFAALADRIRNKAALHALIDDVLMGDTKENWARKLRHLPAGAIREMGEALEQPEVTRRGILKTYRHNKAGAMRIVGSNYRFSDTPVDDSRPPPCLGEHTDAVLRDLAGYSADEIAGLRANKIIL